MVRRLRGISWPHLFIDLPLMALSNTVVFGAFFGISFPASHLNLLINFIFLGFLIRLPIFLRMGIWHAIWRYISINDARNLTLSIFSTSFLMAVLWEAFAKEDSVHVGIFLMD